MTNDTKTENSETEKGKKNSYWFIINSLVLIISIAFLIALFSETVYRDNYINNKSGWQKKETGHSEGNIPEKTILLIDDINNRIKAQGEFIKKGCENSCNTLFEDSRNVRNCISRISQIQPDAKLPLTNSSHPELFKFGKESLTEEDRYLAYLETMELGVKLSFANHLSGPNLFIFIFLFLGMAASSIGNLVVDSLHKRQSGDSTGSPLVGLLLGPVVSCIVGAVLVYVFTPGGDQAQYFQKKLLNIPIAVFISSFMLSFSPVSTIKNIASFVSLQLKSIVGENKTSH